MPVASHTWLASHSVLKLHTSLCPLSQVALHEQAGEENMNTLLFVTTAVVVALQGSLVPTLILERTGHVSLSIKGLYSRSVSQIC